jgi:hypothetical protein
MMSELGSIGIISILSLSLGSRKRLRLISRVPPACSCSTNVQDPVAVGGLRRENVHRLDQREAHPVAAVAEAVADLRVLIVGQHMVGAVHVEAEQRPYR